MEIIEQIGAYAGLASIVGLAILSALYFSQARDVKRLREWAGRAPERAEEAPAQQPVPGRVVAQPQQGRATPAPPAVPPPVAPRPVPGAGAKAAPSPANAAASAAAAGPAAVTAAAKEKWPAVTVGKVGRPEDATCAARIRSSRATGSLPSPSGASCR